MTQKTGTRVRAADGLGVAEIHAHTLASDGMVSATDLVRAAAAIGVNVLCITDHDTISDLEPAIDAGAALGVDVVRGEEVTASFRRGSISSGSFWIGRFACTCPLRTPLTPSTTRVVWRSSPTRSCRPGSSMTRESPAPARAPSRRRDRASPHRAGPAKDVGPPRRLLRWSPRATRRRARGRRQPLRRARPWARFDRVPREERGRPSQGHRRGDDVTALGRCLPVATTRPHAPRPAVPVDDLARW